MSKLISIYERDLPPYPVELNMVAYTDTMRQTILSAFSLMVLHYTDEFGRFYVYEKEWHKLGIETLQNILKGKIKPKQLLAALKNENRVIVALLNRQLRNRYVTGTFLKEINRRIARLISFGDPVGYLIEEPANRELLKQLDPETVAILTKPEQPSFLTKQSNRLFTIVYKQSLSLLRDFAARYPHLIFDYTGPLTTYADFKKQYDELQRERKLLAKKLEEFRNYERETKAAKTHILKTENISKRSQKIAQIVAETAYIFDTRKGFLTRITYLLSKVLDRLAKQLKVDRASLNWLTPNELVAVADGRLSIGSLNIAQRKQDGIFVSQGSNLGYADKKEHNRWLQLIGDSQRQTSDKINGIVGSKGLAKGTARVIILYRDIAKMRQGEILVTPYTAVNFMPAMRKAAAIVTDIGGITSHAAVISRELGIPAVVDTKNATKVLKTGDTVEVNAENGIVRKLR